MSQWSRSESNPLGRTNSTKSQTYERYQRAKVGRQKAREAFERGTCPQCGGEGFDHPDESDTGFIRCESRCGYVARLDPVSFVPNPKKDGGL